MRGIQQDRSESQRVNVPADGRLPVDTRITVMNSSRCGGPVPSRAPGSEISDMRSSHGSRGGNRGGTPSSLWPGPRRRCEGCPRETADHLLKGTSVAIGVPVARLEIVRGPRFARPLARAGWRKEALGDQLGNFNNFACISGSRSTTSVLFRRRRPGSLGGESPVDPSSRASMPLRPGDRARRSQVVGKTVVYSIEVT